MPIIVKTPNTIIKVARPDKIVVVQTHHKVIKIAMGPPGPKGDPGAPGESVEFYVGVPSSTWTIVHNLGKRPAGWTIYDTADTIYEAGAEYLDDDTMRFTFSSPISGRVVLV